MSVASGGATSKSSSRRSSILKSNLKNRLNETINNQPTVNKVRFILPHSKKIKQILQDYKSRINLKEYESLIFQICNSDFSDNDISDLLAETNECISLLNRDLCLFVEAILTIKWIDKNNEIIKQYQSFIVNLISAHNYHAEYVIDRLISLFQPSSTDPDWVDDTPTDEDIRKYTNLHNLIKLLLTVVPMCKDLLMKSLINLFPYMKKSTHIHECYIYNLLWVIQYEPSLKPQVLHLIISKLVIMDVNMPRDTIEKLLDDENDEIFAMENDDVDGKSTIISNSFKTISTLANNLDVCLNRLFNYLIDECYTNNSKELNWDKAKSLYHDIVTVFDQIILPTYNTHHVQFIMFVICTFKQTFSEAFLNYLWKKITNPNIPVIIRQAAVNYLSGLLARVAFVPLTMIKATLQQMANWIHCYISTQEQYDSISIDVRAHPVFYSVCQGLFYLVAFRYDDFVNSKKNLSFLGSLNMAQIVNSRLNPLRVCQPAVLHNFARVTKKYQLAYCYTIIEQNTRDTLPTMYADEKGISTLSDTILDSFYPFDPYMLPRSGEKIYSFYRNYVDSNDFEMEENCEVHDDFLEHQENVQKFSYGVSPGFKFNHT